ncbi:MAG: HNH endonuclease [Moorea sp. SIO4A3]|nr:HNH endonuclease [Moorena sp. SIO4A3]
MRVFVLDKNKKALDPCHPARARKLLSSGRAKVFRRYPFTIIVQEKEAENCITHPHRLKIDPGAKTTGIAIVQGSRVVWGAELTHRGSQIRESLTSRRQLRRTRRSRKTRYRKPRFLNRTRATGWLAPSLQSRVDNILTWVKKLCRYCPITDISQELVRFDTQAMQNPSINGYEYQLGALAGYEVREFILEKWQRTCAYCGAKNTPLEIDHIKPKSKGGSNRLSNLTLACRPCNEKKGNQVLEQFLAKKPDLLSIILSMAKKPLAEATAVNSTRWKLYENLKATELPVEVGSGGLTKYNRSRHNLPKTHCLDAANVGKSTPEKLILEVNQPLLITAKGHGRRQQCRTDKYGFPKRYCSKQKVHFGFRTGDIVKANVTKGKKIGTYVGRVATRASGSFNISTKNRFVQGISHKYCQIVQGKDGYQYAF